MFLNWQDSSKSIRVVLVFRCGKQIVRVTEAELAQLPLEQRNKILVPIASGKSPTGFDTTHENVEGANATEAIGYQRSRKPSVGHRSFRMPGTVGGKLFPCVRR